MNNDSPKKPWYKQPLVWLVIFFPATAVVGGISLLILSLNIDTAVVVDDYYKKGKEINRVLTRDKKAAELGIRGVAIYSAQKNQFSVTLASSEGVTFDNQTITLDLLHGTRGGMDVSTTLDAKEPGLYQTDLRQSLADGPWNVQVSTEQWRVHGRVYIPQNYTAPLTAQ